MRGPPGGPLVLWLNHWGPPGKGPALHNLIALKFFICFFLLKGPQEMSMGENPRGYSSFPEVLGNHTCTDSRPEGGLPGPCSLGMSSDSDVESAGKRTERGYEAGLGRGLHREKLTSPWSLTSLEKLIEVITGGSEGRCPVSTPQILPMHHARPWCLSRYE